MKRNNFISLIDLATFGEKDHLQAVMETPKGSRNKYKYNDAAHCVELASALPAGMVFPFDFGFIPSTLADDGDPLDVLILLDAPVPPCCLLKCRLIGIMEARQKERGATNWTRNDRLIAVAIGAKTHEKVEEIADLSDHFIDDITAFFSDYNKLHGKKFECLGVSGPKKAKRALKIAMDAYGKHKA
ncbi:MAG: inorganic diphosphatase [Steroidobacteraceae bacterium]